MYLFIKYNYWYNQKVHPMKSATLLQYSAQAELFHRVKKTI